MARDTFGFERLRAGQEEAIRAAASGRDTLAVLPTGWGKSAIYQLAALLIPGPTVVVSPLIALQRDQVRSLLANDVAAAEANSQMGAGDRQRALDHLASGDVEFVFLAPEQLAKDEVVAEIAAARPSLFVVDEAHCISAWGHDFRPDYLGLASVVTAVGRPPVLALTATAAPPVREEIVERLALRDPVVVVRGFDRPNISLSVERFVGADEKRSAAVERAATTAGAGIVYVATRRSAEEVAEALAARRVAAAPYHAGLPAAERNATQAAFTEGDLRVIVATTAFGMGIDKPDVRFVHHLDVAESLDAYYQEIGRAGRDGEPARAVLFYRPEDLGVRRFFASGSDDDTRRRVERSRVEMMQAYAEARSCRRRLLLGYFGEQLDGPCGNCDQCTTSDRDEEEASSPGRAPFEVNTRVTHTAWGDGQVLDYEGGVVTVFFESVGYKTLDLDLVAAGDLLRPSG
ncbi:MAG TPA: ATP-dependent DNA helicase RecQ [Acidimicrobiales bacterium]|nr:ATP-dependent DNA helicase RecQ [Acidimicrobiales bacterium]